MTADVELRSLRGRPWDLLREFDRLRMAGAGGPEGKAEIVDCLCDTLSLHAHLIRQGGSAQVVLRSPCNWAVLRQLQAARMTIIEVPLGDDGRFDLQQFQMLAFHFQHQQVHKDVGI